MRIAVFTDTFPALSETFIARQIEGLTALSHRVHIYAQQRTGAAQTKVGVRRRTGRVTYMDMPPASGYWEMPAFPPWGRTWLPGATQPIPNATRLLAALPTLARCTLLAPRVSA